MRKLITGFIFTYILIFATFCLEAKMDSALGNTGITKVENVHESNGKITLPADELASLKNTIDEHEKNFDRILSCQQFVYTHSITVLLGLFLFFGGLTFWWNTSESKKFALSRINEMAESLRKESQTTIGKMEKDSADTVQILRTSFLDATNDLRKEFAGYTKESIEKTSKEYEQKFKEFENEYSLALTKLEGYHCNALGRIYEETKNPPLACLWFARGVQKHLKTVTDEEWMKIQLGFILNNLGECIYFGENGIEELKQIFSEIPDEKFKTEKDGLEKALQTKIQEMEAKKTEKKVA